MSRERGRIVPVDRIRGLTDKLFGREAEPVDTRMIYVIPNGPHFGQYLSAELYDALHPGGRGQEIKELHDRLITRSHRRPVDVVRHSSDSATVHSEDFRVEGSSGTTIVKDRLLAANIEKVRRTVFLSTTDLLMGAFFTKKEFTAIEFGNGPRIPKSRYSFEPINRELARLNEGESFKIIASDRTAEVTLLPMPKDDPEFVKPHLYLIGPDEAKNFGKSLRDAKKSGRPLIVHSKRNHVGLVGAYLQQYRPDNIKVEADEDDYRFDGSEGVGKQNRFAYAPSEKGTLNIVIKMSEGYVDELVRQERDVLVELEKAAKEKGSRYEMPVTGIFGVDVTQTGTSLRENRLKKIESVLQLPAYPLQIRVK